MLNKFIMCVYKYFMPVLVAAFFLNGCSAGSEKQIKSKYADKYSAVATQEPSFKPLSGQVFSWQRDVIVANEGSGIEITQDLLSYISTTIEQQLVAKNYKIQRPSERTDYYIVAAVILDDSSKSKQITGFTEIHPGLGSSLNNNQKGSLT